jgi:hypothetical protein
MDKNIYIKTEPGGKISFGKMSEYDVDLFKKSKINGTLSNDILFKIKKGISPYKLFEGVINTGKDKDIGNEGIIAIQEDKIEIARQDSNSVEADFYIVYLSLSKVSIEFKVSNKSSEPYNLKKLFENSVCVNLPSFIKHPIYSDLKFNIVTSYSYDGKLIKSANKVMVDRGYEDAIFIFSVLNNEVYPLYEFVEANEVFF